MHVLLANTFFYPALGGIENYLLNVGRDCRRRGHAVTVLTQQHEPELPRQDTVEGLTVIRYPAPDRAPPGGLLNLWRRLAAVRRAATALLGQQPVDWAIARDVVSLVALSNLVPPARLTYVQATASPLYLLAAARRRHDTLAGRLYWPLANALERHVLGRWERRACRACPTKIVLSDSKRHEVCAYYGFPLADYHVIPAGVDTARFQPVPPELRRQRRAAWALPPEAFVFVYVGRPSPEKNPQGLLEAFSRLPADPLVALLMVGPFDEAFRRDAGARSLPGPCCFTGPIAEPVAAYQAADALVLPSLTEGFGQVLVEAMACGLPCVAYRSPPGRFLLATSEVVVDGETGRLVAYNDPVALALAMSELASAPEQARALGAQGRRRCEAEYRWEHVVDRLLALAPAGTA